MALRDDLLPVFFETRTLMGPDVFDLRTNKVTLRVVTWSGNGVEDGTPSFSDTEILPRPKVVELDGGRLKVGPVTPQFSGGGYTADQLRPLAAFGQTNIEFFYVLDGPNNGEYILTEIDRAKNFGYFLTLEPRLRRRPT